MRYLCFLKVIGYQLVALCKGLPFITGGIILPTVVVITHLGEIGAACGLVIAAVRSLLVGGVQTHRLPVDHIAKGGGGAGCRGVSRSNFYSLRTVGFGYCDLLRGDAIGASDYYVGNPILDGEGVAGGSEEVGKGDLAVCRPGLCDGGRTGGGVVGDGRGRDGLGAPLF